MPHGCPDRPQAALEAPPGAGQGLQQHGCQGGVSPSLAHGQGGAGDNLRESPEEAGLSQAASEGGGGQVCSL